MDDVLTPEILNKKKLGAYYTPPEVARTLVRWVVRKKTDRLLDPACGDGRFLAAHSNSVGVECNPTAVAAAAQHARCRMIHAQEFFSWAENCRERFECAAGNPPFIRYQHFAGSERHTALRLCASLGAEFSALTSSWAPFLVVTASLLRPNGRMAFLVPAEIGHAPYARPLVTYLANNFERVLIIALRTKLFPELSEDVWILCAEGFGGRTSYIEFARIDRFVPTRKPPVEHHRISLAEWRSWNCRLRSFILPSEVQELYDALRRSEQTKPFGEIARIGIGYVTGANDFFHLRPSTARRLGIPDRYLLPTVRNGRCLTGTMLTEDTIRSWKERDEAVLLLRLPRSQDVNERVRAYLNSPAGFEAQATFKCRNRKPWYSVPDVKIPDAFVSYMSGEGPQLVVNAAHCTCTNSVHAVTLTNGLDLTHLAKIWAHPLVRLSCELEGHPLGGGMLKLEPGECARVLLPATDLRMSSRELTLTQEGIDTMRRWRHCE